MALVVLTDGEVTGDLVTVQASVDGRAVTVTCWLSHLSTLGTRAAKVAYVAGLAKASLASAAPVSLASTVTV